MNIDNYLKKYDLKEVFNHDNYVKYMDSKVIRNPRTNTLLDFITEAQEKALREKKISDLSSVDPTPKGIQEHMNFAHNAYFELCKKYEDDFISFLGNCEEGVIVLVSTNWYEKYDYKYNREIEEF